MDRERDRDAAEELIEEHDKKVGKEEPERTRPGQDDPASRPVDSQDPAPEGKAAPDKNSPRSPGLFAPH